MPAIMDTLVRLRRAIDPTVAAAPAAEVTQGDVVTGSSEVGGVSAGDKVKEMVMKQLEKIPCKCR